MKTVQRIGLWVGGFVVAVAVPAATAQTRQQMPCTTPSCSADPMGVPQSGGRSGGTQRIPQSQLPQPMIPDNGPNESKIEHDQAKLRNMDRQKQLVADTQKLVSLANELQADVQKSNKDTLSLDVIRKADEIEKLAKSVRDKMKGS